MAGDFDTLRNPVAPIPKSAMTVTRYPYTVMGRRPQTSTRNMVMIMDMSWAQARITVMRKGSAKPAVSKN